MNGMTIPLLAVNGYLRRPVASLSSLCNDITLNSQEEVDNFQAIPGPCVRVMQNLVIAGEDIVGFNGLSDLTAVLGDLKIDRNPSLINIDGLVIN